MKIINNNIVVVHDHATDSTVSIDSIKAYIATVFTEDNPKPVVAQFPNLIAITVPETQVSLLFEGKRLLVTDQSIGTIDNKNTLALTTLLNKVEGEISIANPVLSYGYNFIYNIDDSEFSTMAANIQHKFFKRSVSAPVGSEIKYLLPNMVLQKDDARITLKFNGLIELQSNEPTKIRLDANVHYSSGTIPPIDELNDSYKEIGKYIEEYVGNIIR